jgi:hypothetical protein
VEDEFVHGETSFEEEDVEDKVEVVLNVEGGC